jgi:hypothetical protein
MTTAKEDWAHIGGGLLSCQKIREAGCQYCVVYVPRIQCMFLKVSHSTCNKAPPNFLFQWTILDDSKKQVEFNAAVQQHAKSITLPSYSLLAGRTYFAELRVISKDATCIIPPVWSLICKVRTEISKDATCIIPPDWSL